MSIISYRKILGINFLNGTSKNAFDLIEKNGGLLTVPAAPGLANIPNDSLYYKALLESDLVIPDSGYMVLIWNLISKDKIKKISGLHFINTFSKNISCVKNETFLLVNPNDVEGKFNKDYFEKLGVATQNIELYSAPFFTTTFDDFILLEIINKQKPKFIFLNIGGGIQEKLGLFIKNNANYKPAIICTGAAIAFKTGKQVKIPSFIDKFYLGWFVRILSNPKLYFKRYYNSIGLLKLIVKHKDKKINNP